MIFQNYKKTNIYIHYDFRKFYAHIVGETKFTKFYDKIDDLRDDLRLNRCEWKSLTAHCHEYAEVRKEYEKTA